MTMKETLGGMREEAFTRSIPPSMSRKDYVALRFRQVLVESEGFDLVAMGRPEGLGCYCFANSLLSEAMEFLEKEYRYVIIDSEAGMEHISRRTVGHPDILLVVSDPSTRGIRTAERIKNLAISIGIEEDHISLVYNRVKKDAGRLAESHLRVIGIIPEDSSIENADIKGLPLARIDRASPIWNAVLGLLEKLRETCKEDKRIEQD